MFCSILLGTLSCSKSLNFKKKVEQKEEKKRKENNNHKFLQSGGLESET